MNRRGFMKMIGLGAVVPVVTLSVTKAIPFLPTIEWLKEYDPRVSHFTATYSTDDTWDALAWRSVDGNKQPEKDWIARLYFKNNKWIAIDHFWRETPSGKMCYENEIEWPYWLRKF